MLDESKENRLFQIFMEVDDFCKSYQSHQKSRGLLPSREKRPGPAPSLSESEVVTLAIFYHQSGCRCFQYYYEDVVLKDLKSFFPAAVSYNRFIELLSGVALPLYLFGQWCCRRTQKTGVYFADSKKLPVCDNRRIYSNRVFKGVAQRGKSSTGWFYGLKLHLTINHLGEIARFAFTPANVSDNDKRVLDILLDGFRLNASKSGVPNGIRFAGWKR